MNVGKYTYCNVNIIDFSSRSMFHKNVIIDAIDILRFENHQRRTRQSYGYRLGQDLLTFLEGDDILKRLICPSSSDHGFYYYRLKETSFGVLYRAGEFIHTLTHKEDLDENQPLGILSTEVVELQEESDELAI